MYQMENGTSPRTFEKETSALADRHVPVDLPALEWDRLEADLKGLYRDQLDLVLRLVEQMKITNEEDKKARNSNRHREDSKQSSM